MSNKTFYIVLTFSLLIIFLRFVFDLSTFFIIFLVISAIIVLILSKSKRMAWFVIALIVVILNMFLLVFALIPTYDWDVNTSNYYAKQENYLTIDIQEEEDFLEDNNARIRIRSLWWDWFSKTVEFNEDNQDKKVPIKEDYIITFQSKTTQMSSNAFIHLRDGTIIRILPQTTIKFKELFKNHKNLMKSKTNINLENWSIWFTAIRTIISDDWFNIQTQNWTLVVRWTSGFVDHQQQDNETNIFSYNHILELIDQDEETHVLSDQDTVRITDWVLEQIDINEFVENVWENIYRSINRFFQQDQEIIENYKQEIVDFIQNEYWWILDDRKRIERLSEIKLYIQSFRDDQSKQNLQNYRKYKLMIWESSLLDFGEDMKNALVVPANEKMESAKLRLLEMMSEENIEAAKSYATNRYNQLLDMWQDIDTNQIENFLKENIDIDDLFDRFRN